MAKLTFYDSRTVRNKVIRSEQEKILYMYGQAAQELGNRINYIGNKMKRWQLMMLKDEINTNMKNIAGTLDEMYRTGMNEISGAVCNDMRRFLNYVNVQNTDKMMLGVPNQVVESIVTGKIYDKKWYLSDAVWATPKKAQMDAESIVARGLAENKDIFQIAKDLETYLVPNKKKMVSWSRYYKGVAGSIEYNSMRLARTLSQHAYQQTFQTVNRYNPFVESYKWYISSNDRVCSICRDREGMIYPKEDLPQDHPNGQCWWECIMTDSMDGIANRLVDWYNSPTGTDADLDLYMEWLENN